MDEEAYSDYCREVYKAELEQTEALYRRYPIAIAAAGVVVAACTYFLSAQHVPLLFSRIDVFLYYLFAATAWLSTVVAIVLLALSMSARKYKLLPGLPTLADYRQKSELHFRTVNEGAKQDDVAIHLADETGSLILSQTIEAQGINRAVNIERRKYFNASIRVLALALIPIFGESIMYSIIQIRAATNGTSPQTLQPSPTGTTVPAPVKTTP